MIEERSVLVVSPSTAAAGALALDWIVAPGDQEGIAVWIRCRDNWLDDIENRSKRKNTRRAYSGDWNEFFQHWATVRLLPWQVGRIHAQGWVQHMRERGLADSTINRKVAALSSFYNYAADEFQTQTHEGPRGLWQHPNPFGSRKLRTAIDPYSRSLPSPTLPQVQALLRQIDTTTLNGKRDMAIILGMFITARRVSEWINIRGKDLTDADNGGKIFRYLYKGGKPKKQLIDPALWNIVQDYLQAAGRWPLQPDDYLFTAHDNAGKRFAAVPDEYDPAGQAISSRRVNAILKSYGRRAGIADECLHAHALRHAGARARRKNGADIYAIKDLLGHSSIAITQIYTDNVLDQPEDALAGLLVSQVIPQQLKLKFNR